MSLWDDSISKTQPRELKRVEQDTIRLHEEMSESNSYLLTRMLEY